MVQRIKNKENLELLAEKIRQVDVVVIGGGSGLSSAAGYNHYHWMPYLEGQLQDFKEAYGFQSPFILLLRPMGRITLSRQVSRKNVYLKWKAS